MKCLATDGRWVLYGLLGGRQIEGNLFGQLLGKRGQLMATTLRTRSLSVSVMILAQFSKVAVSINSIFSIVTGYIVRFGQLIELKLENKI